MQVLGSEISTNHSWNNVWDQINYSKVLEIKELMKDFPWSTIDINPSWEFNVSLCPIEWSNWRYYLTWDLWTIEWIKITVENIILGLKNK